MRRILSLWVPHFHTAVEALLEPPPPGRPLVVVAGGYPNGRVVDAAAEAAALGVAPGMSWRHARRRCPGALLRRYERARFAPAAEQAGNILYCFTPWAEFFPGAEGELFADLGEGGPEEGLEMARAIRARLAGELGLPARLALATGKLAARGKAREAEEGIALVSEGRERAFLAPQPVETVWDLKPDALRRLHLLGLRQLGQVAVQPAGALAPVLGPAAGWYRRLARGVDHRAVAAWSPAPAEREVCSVEAAEPDRALLEALLEQMAARIAARLLRSGRRGRVVSLGLRLSGRTLFAARRLKEPVSLPRALFLAARALLPERWEAGDGAGGGAVELSVSGLEGQGALQLSIFRDEDRTPALRAALARLQDRFGERAVMPGSCFEAWQDAYPSR